MTFAQEVARRKNGRLVKSEDIEGAMWAWIGDIGHGKRVSPYKGHNFVDGFYDPQWGKVAIEFEGMYAGQPVNVRGSIGLDR